MENINNIIMFYQEKGETLAEKYFIKLQSIKPEAMRINWGNESKLTPGRGE